MTTTSSSLSGAACAPPAASSGASSATVPSAGALSVRCADSTACPPILLRAVRIDHAPVQDVLIENGRMAAIGPALPVPDGATVLDCAGALLLPSFIDPHVHLDKTRFGGPRLHHQPTSTVAQRAANEVRLRQELAHDPFEFGSNLVRRLICQGTTHIRSHIDVDPHVKLRHVEAVLKIRERFSPYVDIRLVAFPQSGIITAPGVERLLREAVALGVDAVGGLDPQTFDGARDAHLDSLFALAEQTGVDIDIHLHEPEQIGLASIRAIIARTRALGMKGRVNLSHAYALGQVPQNDLDSVLPQLAELGISVATSAPGAVPFPRMDDLLEAGVTYMGMSDNIQDMWSPWGTGDQLERAMLLAYRHGYRADAPLRRCFDMVTRYPARLFDLPAHGLDGLVVGAAANLTAVQAEDVESALLQRPPRLFTMKDGVLLARDGHCLM